MNKFITVFAGILLILCLVSCTFTPNTGDMTQTDAEAVVTQPSTTDAPSEPADSQTQPETEIDTETDAETDAETESGTTEEQTTYGPLHFPDQTDS